MAYAPLGRGFLTATMKTLDALLPKDRRREHPRFNPDNIKRNAELLAPLEQIAAAAAMHAGAGRARMGARAGRRHFSDSRHRSGAAILEQNIAAFELALTADEVAALTKAFPPGVTAGTRYPEKQLKALGI